MREGRHIDLRCVRCQERFYHSAGNWVAASYEKSKLLLHLLRCKYDEPYRIKTGFGLSPIRTQRELKALIAFCKAQLEEEHMSLNLDLQDVYSETVRLYEKDSLELRDYINSHVEWYWS